MALKAGRFRSILPSIRRWCSMNHRMEYVAIDYFGQQISNFSFLKSWPGATPTMPCV